MINNLKIILNIIALPLTCLIFIKLFKLGLDYSTIFAFSLFIILFNLKKLKNHFVKSLILSVILSFVTIYVAIGIYFGFGYIIMQIIDLDKLDEFYFLGIGIKKIILIIPIAIISPLLMFYSYRIIFKIKKNKFYKNLIKMSLLLLIITTFISYRNIKNFKTEHWQFIMALSLQLLLYQDELKKIFNPIKNEQVLE